MFYRPSRLFLIGEIKIFLRLALTVFVCLLVIRGGYRYLTHFSLEPYWIFIFQCLEIFQ